MNHITYCRYSGKIIWNIPSRKETVLFLNRSRFIFIMKIKSLQNSCHMLLHSTELTSFYFDRPFKFFSIFLYVGMHTHS